MEHSTQIEAGSHEERFAYRSLDRQLGEIRLLHILPNERQDAPIICTLEYYPLEDPDTGYEALSYTWGSSERTESILIDDKPFAITRNLLDALVMLRDPRGYRVLWVDALCINQDDLEERGVQVLRMLRIYQRAERVVVWLGSESPNSGLAMQHFRELDTHWKFRRNPALRTRLMRFTLGVFVRFVGVSYGALTTIRHHPFVVIWLLISFAGWLPLGTWDVVRFFTQLVTTVFCFKVTNSIFKAQSRVVHAPINIAASPNPEIITALRGFFGRSWFRRVWIVQEVAAAQDVLVMCGSEEIPWWLLSNALKEIQHRAANASIRSTYLDTDFLRGPLPEMVSTAAMGTIKHIVYAFDGDDSAATDRLEQLLRLFRYAEATDMRDKVYALLGLCHTSPRTEQSDGAQQCPGAAQQRAVVDPSYEIPVWRVYAQVVRSLTTSGHPLNILRQCQGHSMLDDLPTWAPDWTCRYMDASSRGFMERKDLSFQTLPSPELHTASFSKDLRHMTARGFIIGTISGRTSFLSLDGPNSKQASAPGNQGTSSTQPMAAPPTWQISRENIPGIYVVAAHYYVAAFTWAVHSGLFQLCLEIIIAGCNLFQRLFPSSVGPHLTFTMRFLQDFVEALAAIAAYEKQKKRRAAALRKLGAQSAKSRHLHEESYDLSLLDALPLNKDSFFESAAHNSRFIGASDDDLQTQPRWKLQWETNIHETFMGAVDIDATCRDPREGDVVVLLVGSHDAHLLRDDEEDGLWSLVGIADLSMRVRWMWRDAVREFDEGKRELHTFTMK